MTRAQRVPHSLTYAFGRVLVDVVTAALFAVVVVAFAPVVVAARASDWFAGTRRTP